MSRTSRKSTVQVSSAGKTYCTAGYVRLSVIKPNQLHSSVENQKDIIEDFISNRSDMNMQKFYIDENISGTSFERRGFEEMLDDISQGEIDCVVVKDLSRFGRDAIEVGFYLQHLFPQKGVRFISILDQFDTLDGITDISFDKTAGIRIPIINIFNGEYTADIRRKTQASIDANIHEGKYIAPRAPYGYMKSPDDCHLLLPDPEAASVVKEIFSMARDKISLNEIVRRLNLAHISTPIDYALSRGLEGNYDRGNGAWNSRSVKYILTNRTYTGDLHQGKDGYVVENTHKALVDREEFMRIQDSYFKLSANSETAPKAKEQATDNPLKGKVICGSCGGKMQRRKGSSNDGWYFFSCITNNRKGYGCSTGMYIRESSIMEQIQSELKKRERHSQSLSQSDLDEIIRNDLIEVIVNKSGQLDIYFK